MAQRPSATNTEPPLLKPLLKRSNSMSDIDFTFLKEHLHYDSQTGNFVWIKSPAQAIKAGTKAGNIRPDGYTSIQVKGRLYFAHRLAWLLMTGVWPDDMIDHINGNRSDNRFANLRQATRSQNMQNKKPAYNSKSGYTGVTWTRAYNCWVARIMVNKKSFHIGHFKTLVEAIDARKQYEKELFTHAPLH
jgi:hypothetical protein